MPTVEEKALSSTPIFTGSGDDKYLGSNTGITQLRHVRVGLLVSHINKLLAELCLSQSPEIFGCFGRVALTCVASK